MSRGVENGLHHFVQLGFGVVVDQLEQTGSDGGRHAQDDPLRDAVDRVRLAVVSRVEQVVGRFLKLKRNSLKNCSISTKNNQNLPKPN